MLELIQHKRFGLSGATDKDGTRWYPDAYTFSSFGKHYRDQQTIKKQQHKCFVCKQEASDRNIMRKGTTAKFAHTDTCVTFVDAFTEAVK